MSRKERELGRVGGDFLESREYHTPSSGIFFKAKRLLYKQKSAYQEIEVIENEYFGKVLLLDGLVQTTERDEFFYHEILVHPGFMVHPNPQRILIIGGGDGGVLREALRYPVEGVVLVEIDPQMIEVSKRYFPWLSPALEDGRAELVIEDGKNFLKGTDKTFDIIFVDSSDPVGPSVVLHDKDFYEIVKKRLNFEGIVVAQVGSPFFNLDSIVERGGFLKEIFRIVRFYVGTVPTYPGGSWCYVFLSDEIEPFSVRRRAPEGLKYFNLDVYEAVFALPNFMKTRLDK